MALPQKHVSSLKHHSPRRALAVTFDDLPLQKIDPDERLPPLEVLCKLHDRLLSALSAARIPAIGFVNETRLHDYPCASDRRKVLDMWLIAGLELGNHSFSHVTPATVPLSRYCEDVVRGESLLEVVLAEHNQKLTFFRHPKLHTGHDLEYKEALERFLAGRSYRVAPVTIKHQDWAFAIAYNCARTRGDEVLRERITREYMAHLEACFEYFERLSLRLLGYELKQVLLLHVNQLNADHLPAISEMIQERGYEFISLSKALTDAAYQLPDRYVGMKGPSWLQRWAITKGIAVEEEPSQPLMLREILATMSTGATVCRKLGHEDVPA